MWNQHRPLARAFLLILLFLVGCNSLPKHPSPAATIDRSPFPATTSIPTISFPVSPSSTVIPTLTPLRPTDIFIEPTATKKSRPGYIPLETATSTPTNTATLDPASIKPVTPAPAASCPSVPTGPAPTTGFFGFNDTVDMVFQTPEEVLNYLNAYGARPFIQAYDTAVARDMYHRSLYYQDLTHDGIPEIMMTLYSGISRALFIFGCRDNQYQVLFEQPTQDGYLAAYRVIDIRDGNRNGIPEIIFWTGTMSQGGHYYQVYEWNGKSFDWLLTYGKTEYYSWWGDVETGLFVEISGEAYYQNIDNDYIDEVVVKTGIPTWSNYYSGLPYRNITRYHKWDGQHYSFLRQDYDPAEYRFQAIQDGDRFSLSREYERALDSYQLAIFSNKLKGWSEEYRLFLQNVWAAQTTNQPTPIPPSPDPNEYPNLAAYARYRIMLIHLLNNHLPEAQIVYDTLQKLFPEGKVGHPYMEMAQAFRDDYQNSMDMGQACNAAIQYAKDHPEEILSYLGMTDNGKTGFGWQSLNYTPESICPFQ